MVTIASLRMAKKRIVLDVVVRLEALRLTLSRPGASLRTRLTAPRPLMIEGATTVFDLGDRLRVLGLRAPGWVRRTSVHRVEITGSHREFSSLPHGRA